jgi:putative heme-binding domain-containing protein
LNTTASQQLIRQLLEQEDDAIRHAALNVVSLYRDAEAGPQVVELLSHDAAAVRRAAAEALGRIGDASAVPRLLAASAHADDRSLQHSITYALIELNEPAATRAGLASREPRTVGAALVALDQMPNGTIEPGQVIPLLSSSNPELRQTARWLVTQHTDWGGELVEWFRSQLKITSDRDRSKASDAADSDVLESMLVGFAGHSAIQELLGDVVRQPASSNAARTMALRVMAAAKLSQSPDRWRDALSTVIAGGDAELVSLAVAATRALPATTTQDALHQALLTVASTPQNPPDLRVAALAVSTAAMPQLSEPQFELLVQSLSPDNPVVLRSAAADAISHARLSAAQLEQLCSAIKLAGPLELSRLLPPFAKATDERSGRQLLASLAKASALSSLRFDLLRETLANNSPDVQREIDKLESIINIDAGAQRKRIEELLPHMASGDIRRGHAVYYSAKASCSACHVLGHAGGKSGPELTRIGESRTERDLLESILFPSLSFVRSYEPVLIITVDGRAINGTIRDETADEFILTTGPDQEVRLRRDEVDELQPSTVSVMPIGLDKQLTTQEIADLVAFLKNAKGN